MYASIFCLAKLTLKLTKLHTKDLIKGMRSNNTGDPKIDQILFFKILAGHESIDPVFFIIKTGKIGN